MSGERTTFRERTPAASPLRRRRFCVAALLLLVAVTPAAANINQRTLYEVVFPNYLANFAAYVRWPEPAMPENQPVRFGVFGPEASVDLIRDAFKTRTVRGRRVIVEANPAEDRLTSCHILLLDRPTPEAAARVGAAVAGQPVLVVSFVPDDSVEGPAIRLLLRGGSVRYRLALDRLTQAGLAPSPELLQLALPPTTTDSSRRANPRAEPALR